MKKRPFWLTVVLVVDSSNSIVLLTAMADADLQIRRGGGHPDPGIRKRAVSPKNFFRFLGPHFRRKIRGVGAGSPGLSHGFATDQYFFFFLLRKSLEKRFLFI